MSETQIMNTPFGGIITTDEELNRIIRSVEAETGSKLGTATMAVTFDDDPDEKIYLVLLSIYPDSEDTLSGENIKDWSIKIGRQATYDYLRSLVKNETIDPNRSFIIAADKDKNSIDQDDAKFTGKAITVFRFLKVMFENHKVLDDREDFDINEFDPQNWETGDITIIEA